MLATKVIRTSTRVAPNAPDRAAASPRTNEYAVVLGKASTARAMRLAVWMRTHGAPTYVAKLNDSEQLISFGVFRRQDDAERLATTLRLAYDVPVFVQPGSRPMVLGSVDERIEGRILRQPP